MSSAEVSSSSLFDKLPVELLKRIVELVEEQDKVFNTERAHQRVGRCELEKLPDGSICPEDTKPLDGKWSFWHGRGVAALSTVDKATRSLCLPVLLETVTFNQLMKPFFRYEVLQRPDFHALITHLDLRNSISQPFYIISPFLSFISFRRLTVNAQSALFRDPLTTDDLLLAREEAYALTALKASVRQVTSVKAEQLNVPTIQRLLDALDLPALRQFRLTRVVRTGDAAQLFTLTRPNEGILQAFQQMRSLETLELDDSASSSFRSRWSFRPDPTWTALSFPSLTALTLDGDGGKAPRAFLDLVPVLAPNVRYLRFHNVNGDILVPSSPQSLVHFRVSSGAESYDVTFPSPCFLQVLDIETEAFEETSLAYNGVAPEEFPDSFRLFILRLKSGHLPADLDSYTAACNARGVAFRFIWEPDLWAMGQSVSCHGYDSDLGFGFRDKEHFLGAAYETLDWAKRRLDWAQETGDVRSAHEVIQALYRVRERQLIEMQ